MKIKWIVCFVAFLCFRPLGGQEFIAMVGGLQSTDATADRACGWQLSYRQAIRPRVGLSYSWTNEGHLPNHHRDGSSLQVWVYMTSPQNSWSLAIGVGPYRSYDTISSTIDSHGNLHGIGGLFSLQGGYSHKTTPYTFLVQAFAIRIPGQIGTTGLQAGLSYRFDEPARKEAMVLTSSGAIRSNAFGLLVGRSVLNSFKSEVAEAWILEYRRALTRHWSLAVTYANEGDTAFLQRDGLSLQAWVSGRVDGRFFLGMGAGPILARIATSRTGEESRDSFRRIGLRVGMEAGWQLGPEWIVRMVWNRTHSSYDRDTDMFLTGLSFLW